MTNIKLWGALAGLIIGVVWVWFGPLNAFFVVLFVLGGWLIAKFWAGEIDLLDEYERFMRSRGKRPKR
jgi:hypothetical protein